MLGHGQSSRLYQTLVKEREICQQVYVGTDDRRGPDLFSVFGILASGHQPAEAQNVVFEELRSVAERGITTRELEKAHNRVRSYFVFGLQSNMSRARQLAEYEMYFGDAALVRTELDRYLAVTREDVQRVAGRYFDAGHRTVLDVLPTQGAMEGGGEAEGTFFRTPSFAEPPGFRVEVTR